MQVLVNPTGGLVGRLLHWVEKTVGSYRDQRKYERMLSWNRALDTFMHCNETWEARLRIREAFDQAFADAGFVPTDVWRGGERFTDGREGGELVDGSRLFNDPLSEQAVKVLIRLEARYDGALHCVLAANTVDQNNPYVYATRLFTTRTATLPATSKRPWGVAHAFRAALRGVLAEQDYPVRIREACQAIRSEMDAALAP